MKFTTLSSAAIAAVLTIGASVPTAAFAEATSLDSTGTVTVEEGGDEESPGVVDSENPNVILPAPNPEPGEEVNSDLGALMIERTSNLDFGTIKTSANEVTAFAAPVSFGEGESAMTRGAYVQWRDIRAGGVFGYTLTAELSQQFTGSSANTLNGSTIDFTNGFAAQQGDNITPKLSDVATAFQLTESGGAQTIVNADKDEQEGKGRYIMSFGKNEEATDGNSVQLTVPATTASNMAIDTYTAKVTWKVVASQ